MHHIREHAKPRRPIRVIQFGGGVFLRGFIDWMLQKAIQAERFDGSVMIVRSRTRGEDPLSAQNYNYTHIAQDGSHREETLVDCIAGSVCAADDYAGFLALADDPDTQVIISNTTEAGIVYTPCPRPTDICPESFPAKLTALLHRRYAGEGEGMLIVPCELIEGNGDILRDCVLRHATDWDLGDGFVRWVHDACSFRNTLVDRIVSGAPTDGTVLPTYGDEMVNTSEYFHLFCIEGEEDPRLPLSGMGLNVRYAPSIADYRTIKVRILNGAHTSMIPYAMLRGIPTVGDCLADDEMRSHLTKCMAEITASMDMEPTVTEAYAADVLERFANPHIHHLCSAIALNSVSKFRVRVLPSILEYRVKYGKNPAQLVLALGKLIAFYRHGEPRDAEETVRVFRESTVEEILSRVDLWGADISFLAKEAAAYADPSL